MSQRFIDQVQPELMQIAKASIRWYGDPEGFDGSHTEQRLFFDVTARAALDKAGTEHSNDDYTAETWLDLAGLCLRIICSQRNA